MERQVAETLQETGAEQDFFTNLDKLLVDSNSVIDIFQSVTPANWRQERNRFLQQRESPQFAYNLSASQQQAAQDQQQELMEHLDQLNAYDFESPFLQQIQAYYRGCIQDTLQKIQIICNLDNADVVKDASRRIWGEPSPQTVAFAVDILTDNAAILEDLLEDNGTVHSSQLKRDIDRLFDTFGLEEWRTEHTEKTTHVKPAQKTVYINTGNKDGIIFSRRERLLLHEFGVHVLRAANGWDQPFNVFGIGIHNYETTEEGITAYLEYRTGYMTVGLLKEYALRTIAVDSVSRNDSFTKTFNHLHSYDVDEQKAFYTAMRAHRGGGFIKDHIYLEGFNQLLNHFTEEASLSSLAPLYLGKIPVSELDTVQVLHREDYLVDPEHSVNTLLEQLTK